MKNIVILGSTGSIGQMTLDVIERIGEYNVEALATHSNINLLRKQIKKFKPKYVCIYDEKAYFEFKKNPEPDVNAVCGNQGLLELIDLDSIDFVMAALVGAVGLSPIFKALSKGLKVAVANKEPIVIAGDILMKVANANNTEIFPVDSEHSAIYQCLMGERKDEVRKFILTASGGPFHDKPTLQNVTKEEALKHPRWKMGPKITIDSATMMNKGFEVIEAHHLFGLSIDKIDVIIHPESIIHSMVEFVDGSIKAHLGKTDMTIPIQFALTYPKRLEIPDTNICFESLTSLNFKKVDYEKFRCLKLAYEAIKKGNGYPVVLNAANEILVDKFLKGELSFLDIPNKLEKIMNSALPTKAETILNILELDKKVRKDLLVNLF